MVKPKTSCKALHSWQQTGRKKILDCTALEKHPPQMQTFCLPCLVGWLAHVLRTHNDLTMIGTSTRIQLAANTLFWPNIVLWHVAFSMLLHDNEKGGACFFKSGSCHSLFLVYNFHLLLIFYKGSSSIVLVSQFFHPVRCSSSSSSSSVY